MSDCEAETERPDTLARSALASLRPELYWGGRSVSAATGETFDVSNPSDGKHLIRVAAAGPEDIDQAVQAAHQQFEQGHWPRMSGAERGWQLLRLADLIERDQFKLAALETLDNGKPYSLALAADVQNLIDTFRYFAGWADKLEGRSVPTAGAFGRSVHAFTIREPLGVIGAIGAYNAPSMYLGWKAAAALAVGNTVVFKPAEEAPLTALHVAGLIQEAGFPPGMFSIMPGLGPVAGSALARHPLVAKLSFTGGGAIGKIVAREAAETFKPVTLELGGKAPQIVFADADLDAVIPILAAGLFANQGQICAAGTRVLVEQSIADVVARALADSARAQVVGDPFDPATTMGPLATARGRDRVLAYVKAGHDDGARLLAGGRSLDGDGYWVEPTVFAGDNAMRIAREEIFGPVGTVIPFACEDEGVAIANDTPFGLNAGIFTRDVSRMHRVARRLRAGAIWVNGWALIDPRLPWGGIKASGYGRENGHAGIEDVSYEKVVSILL